MGSTEDLPARSQSSHGTNAEMIARLLAAAGVAVPDGGYGLRVLTTIGRRTGRAHLTPVGVLRFNAQLYVVCPDRTRDWPRNLLAEPECTVRSGSQEQRYRAVRVTGGAGVDVVATYLSVVQAPWALRAFRLADPTDHEQIAASLGRFGVFRLDSCDRQDVFQ